MAFRFFRRIKLAPGLSLNLSKRGGSLSLGPRGAKITAGTSGVRATAGLPGTGLWYSEKVGGHSAGADSGPPVPTVRPESRLSLNFFQRLFTSEGEENFVDGARCLALGDERKAYEHLRRAVDLADAAFLAGTLALKFERFEEAGRHLGYARRNHRKLGELFARYGIDAAISLPITERIGAQVGPSMRGVLLALVEAREGLGEWREAVRTLRALVRKEPRDPVLLLSLVELLVAEAGDDRACREAVRRTCDVDNESEMHAAILLWKGRALHRLGLHTAARDALTAAFRRKKGRDEELLRAIQYQRALVYEALGRRSRARGEMEKLYARAPDYEDVADRLGLAAS